MKTKSFLALVFLLSAGFVWSSCAIVDELLAMQAADSVDLAQNESSLSSTTMDGLEQDTTPEQAAEKSVQNLGLYYKPAGCAVGTIDSQDSSKVTWELDHCTGPFGFVTITGTINAQYSSITDGVKVHYTGTGVKFNKAVMDLDTDVELTFDGTTRNRSVTTHTKGLGPRGNDVERQGTYQLTWDWDSHCLGLDGSWDTMVDNKTWSTTVTNWERCENECPKSGGKIEFKGGIRNVTVTLDFDGSDHVAWESSRGSSGSIALDCSE